MVNLTDVDQKALNKSKTAENKQRHYFLKVNFLFIFYLV